MEFTAVSPYLRGLRMSVLDEPDGYIHDLMAGMMCELMDERGGRTLSCLIFLIHFLEASPFLLFSSFLCLYTDSYIRTCFYLVSMIVRLS